MGLYSDANAVFDEILAGDELKVTAAMGKSRVYFILGEHSKGINMLEISLSFAGVDTNETAYILSNMAAHSIYSAEYVQANRYLDRALELNPDNILCSLLGRISSRGTVG
jgi:tetratricopeptide (TPR) repeat protein